MITPLSIRPPVMPRRSKMNVAAIFSDEDSDLQSISWRLNAGKYAYIGRRVNGKQVNYLAHRVVLARILGRELTEKDICDHINRNRLDNRRCNLRLVTMRQNNQNRNPQPFNVTGYKGIHFCNTRKKWLARAGVNRKTIYGGSFDTPQEAGARAAQLRKELGFIDNV